jgi:hypothetical protein
MGICSKIITYLDIYKAEGRRQKAEIRNKYKEKGEIASALTCYLT